ncbi:cytochrome c [Donghicola sp. XS_ASV15]|uniref:c-type cytochrome n=1 Tax=Donghicola sp. XS_ASV15 TaxID=3241295 RepID=UPI0035136799
MRKTYAAIVLLALGTAALAHSGVEDKHVMARMDVMKSIGDQMKIVGAMAKGQAAFDGNTANAAIGQIAQLSSQVPATFATPATDPKSEALPEIWTEWEQFEKLANDSEIAAASAVGTIATPEDLDTALRQIGVTCKACHSKYRD